MPQDLEQLDQGDHADTLQSRGLYMLDGLRDRDGGGGGGGGGAGVVVVVVVSLT